MTRCQSIGIDITAQCGGVALGTARSSRLALAISDISEVSWGGIVAAMRSSL